MKHISYILLLVGASLLLPSCQKYLDVKSNSALTTPQTVQDLQALLDDASLMNLQTASYGEQSADDYFIVDADYNSLSAPEIQMGYTWTPHDYIYPNDWSYSATAIYNANICLETLDKNPANVQTQTAWNNVKGSGLFFRAYWFLNLAWDHAKAYDSATASTDLGIPLRTQSDFNAKFPRSNVNETYQQILSDARAAAVYLPDNPAHVLRPSKSAAYGLLARTFLSMRQYDSAYKYADLALKIKSSLINYNSVNTTAATPFTQYNAETVFYNEINGNNYTINPFFARIDTVLYATYASNDLRKPAFFTANAPYFAFKGSYSANSSLFSGITTAELYLIRAEGSARKGDKTTALADLNILIANRYTTGSPAVTATDATDALNKILVEERKELIMRGLRWMQIKRLNKEGRNIVPKRIVSGKTYTLQPNENRYALPLPIDVVTLGVQQNPQ